MKWDLAEYIEIWSPSLEIDLSSTHPGCIVSSTKTEQCRVQSRSVLKSEPVRPPPSHTSHQALVAASSQRNGANAQGMLESDCAFHCPNPGSQWPSVLLNPIFHHKAPWHFPVSTSHGHFAILVLCIVLCSYLSWLHVL